MLDFSSPFEPPRPAPTSGSGGGGSAPSEDNIAMVMSLGFTKEQAIKALKATVSVCVQFMEYQFTTHDQFL